MKHYSHPHTADRGFIALISVIIISMILLTLIVTLNTSSFFNRFDVLDAENKRVSLGLAESCVNEAILKEIEDSSYAGNESLQVDSTDPKKKCQVCAFSPGASPTILTRAVYNGAYTNLTVQITITASNTTINSWKETSANSTCTIM